MLWKLVLKMWLHWKSTNHEPFSRARCFFLLLVNSLFLSYRCIGTIETAFMKIFLGSYTITTRGREKTSCGWAGFSHRNGFNRPHLETVHIVESSFHSGNWTHYVKVVEYGKAWNAMALVDINGGYSEIYSQTHRTAPLPPTLRSGWIKVG